MTRAVTAAAVVIGLMLVAAPTRAEDVTARAKFHYDAGVTLFEERKHEQALIEFAAANDIKPRPAAVFMMAQCEYLLGRLKEARAHYQDYIDQVGAKGEFVELARDRVTSIDRWPSTFAINTVPDEATVTITPRVRRVRPARSSPPAWRPTTSRCRAAATASTSSRRTTRARRASSTSASPRPSRCSSSWTRSRRGWRSRPSRRAPRCTSTATAPVTRTGRRSLPAASRCSPRRPITCPRRWT